MTTSFVGRRVPAVTVRVRREPLRLPLLLLIFWWLLKLLVRLLLRVAGSPVAVTTLTVLTLTWVVCRLANPLSAVAGFLGLAGVLVAIRFRWPVFFQRRVRLPFAVPLAGLVDLPLQVAGHHGFCGAEPVPQGRLPI